MQRTWFSTIRLGKTSGFCSGILPSDQSMEVVGALTRSASHRALRTPLRRLGWWDVPLEQVLSVDVLIDQVRQELVVFFGRYADPQARHALQGWIRRLTRPCLATLVQQWFAAQTDELPCTRATAPEAFLVPA